jgi:hypothetical protein
MWGSVAGSSSSEDALTGERAAWDNVQERATVPRHCPAFRFPSTGQAAGPALANAPYESPPHRQPHRSLLGLKHDLEKACPGLDPIGADLSDLPAVMPAKAGIQ